MNTNSKYTPIPCAFHDYIEHFATLRKPITIQFLEKDAIVTLEQQIINDLTGGRNGEFIHIIQGEKTRQVRMDHIISVDQIQLADYNTKSC